MVKSPTMLLRRALAFLLTAFLAAPWPATAGDSGFVAALSAIQGAVRTPPRERPAALPLAAAPVAVRGWADIIADLGRLPGTVSFKAARLDPAPMTLGELNPDTPLAIGSAFKLYILAALVEHKVNWRALIPIKEALKSFPSGVLQESPSHLLVPVHTLALLMISISDNTATDHLVHLLGRPRLEAILRKVGNADPSRSIPFLSTMEMFKLKADPALRQRYLAADVAGRRALLDNEVRAMTRDQAERGLANWDEPIAIDSLEWFASASDLCRLMDRFQKANDKTALGILAVNPGRGVDIPFDRFDYIGFKGGSEPGVLNLTWLLKAKDGSSWCLTAGWNDANAPVDMGRILPLIQDSFLLVAR